MDHNLQKYLAFVKTVETGSFTRAAESLCYTQSSVSKMIADLEKEWNMVLLERDRGGVHLTTAGEQLLPYARMLIEDYERLAACVREMQGVETGMLRIGTVSSVSIHWLPRILAKFQKDYPKIEYEMLLGDYEEIEGWIAEGRVDCGFVRLPTRPEFEIISLKQDEHLVVLQKGHPLAEKVRIDIRDLEGIPFLLLEHGGKTDVSDLLEKNGVKPDIRFTTWEDFAIMAMAEKGLGVGILSQLILQRIPFDVEVRRLTEPYYRELGLAFPDRKRLSPACLKFLEYLRYREE